MNYFRSLAFILLFVSVSVPATFEFTDAPTNNSYYINMGRWNGLDNMSSTPLTIPIRSCFFFCLGRAEYYLRAYNFGFTHENSAIDSELALARITFSQVSSGEAINLIGTYPTSGIMPVESDVSGQLTLHILDSALDSAQPGKYRARVTLDGYNNPPFWDGREEDTRYLDVDVEVPDRVKISGLNDVVLTSSSSNAVTSAPMNFCVFSQGGSDFQLKANSTNDAGSFVLQQGSNAINYDLLVNHPDYSSLPPNSFTSPWSGSKTQSCADEGGSNMSLSVHIPGGQNANTGVYTDTVTLTVMPM
ncbi:hypothetical protein [uncultured Endozoicomonas sp.]|uniref:hypothetical protein n=1 Tax=uncultured Endozoicomonas sp. TaxID=432652 RepID=UPI0026240747|nr:hypothetical protein [uncultured Endozoicomonas sp.]